jgi:spermidine synthase
VFAAVLDFAIGFILLAIYRKRFRRSPMFYVIGGVMILPSFFMGFDPSLVTSGAFRAYKDLHPDEKIIVRDGKTATISFHESNVHYYIKTNGKADASMSKDRNHPIEGDELTQAATAFMPMAVMSKPYDAAMVGFGSGMGAHYLLSDPLLKDFDCVEIEEEMMNLAKGFYPWNSRGYDDPRTHIYIDDANTFFLTNRRQYDLIVSVPSNPWVSGVASLFSHEFYAKMRRYMKPGGLWVQWIQTYEFNDQLFLNILKALDVVFPYVSLYKAPEEPDIIIIASDQPVIQKSIDRFKTDPVLVKEFERIHRDPEFFGERNFLFTSKMVSSLLDGVEPNSTFIPMVDNKAEEARFIHSNAHIVQVFDSCEICWPEYLDSADYALRRPDRVKALMDGSHDPFIERALLGYLNSIDTTVQEVSPEWKKFRMQYIEWVRGVPFEARDTNEIYAKIRELVNLGRFPASFTDEFNITEVARTKDYETAANLVADFYEKYEVKDMDEFFLRNAILIAFLAREPELAHVLYREAIYKHESFFPVEKLLISKEIKKLRRAIAMEKR